jgi:hypothetical protein
MGQCQKKKEMMMPDNDQVVDCIKLYLSMPRRHMGGVKVELHSFLTSALSWRCVEDGNPLYFSFICRLDGEEW